MSNLNEKAGRMSDAKEYVLYECIAGKETPPGPPDDWEPSLPRHLVVGLWEQTRSTPAKRFFIVASEGQKSAFTKAMEVCFKRLDAKTSEDLPKPFSLNLIASTAAAPEATPGFVFAK